MAGPIVTRRAALLIALLLVSAAAWQAWRVFRPGAPDVILIGIDGADPAIVQRLIRAGRLPTLARLTREGAFGPLRSREPLLSPIVWTTIATGRAPQDHGVLDFVETSADGRVVPITSSRRRVPALWNLASANDVSSGFIGWYASFPAEPVRGFAVSDRIAFHQVRSERSSRGSTHPADLREELERRFGVPSPDAARTRARFTEAAASLTPDGSGRIDALARIVATTDYYAKITPWLQHEYGPRVLGVYFELVDACSHLFMEDAPPRRPHVADEDYAAFAGTADRCYEYQDEVLGNLLDATAGSNTLTIVVSDHGFKTGARRPDTAGRVDEGLAPLWHLPNGIIVLDGPNVARGAAVHDATIFDIVPTVLQALSLPLSRELRGQPLRAAFHGGPLLKEPTRINRYAWTPLPPIDPADAEAPERLAELKALGYVSGSGDRVAHDADGRTATSYLNEGISLAVDGEARDALLAFERAATIDPANVNARAFAARIHLQQHDYQTAAALLDRAAALDPRSVYVRLLRANLAISTGALDRARTELDAAAALDSHLPMLYIQRARLFNALHQPAAAYDQLATAETLTDTEALLLDVLLLREDIARQLGRTADAEAALARAGTLLPPDRLAAARAEVALGRGAPGDALSHLEAAVARDPKSADLWAMLGAARGRIGQYDAAIAAYERAVALNPSPLSCKTLAALLFEIRHDRARAVELWRKSLDLDPRQPDVQRFLEMYGGR